MDNDNKEIAIKEEATKPAMSKKPTLSDKVEWWIVDTVSILFWIYLLVKVFIFDIDNYIITKFAFHYIWLIQYKFIILLATLTLIWIFTKSQKIIAWSAYVILYPLIIIFWKIPKRVYEIGNWNVGIAIVNFLFSFFKSIKYTFIIFSLFIISGVLILSISNKIVILIASLVLLGVLTVTYLNRFILVFKPSFIYKIHLKILSKVLDFSKKNFMVDKDLKTILITDMSNAQLQKWSEKLQVVVIANKVCYFLSSKLRNYQKSRVGLIFNIFNVILLLISTVLCFSLINFGIYKIYPEFYQLNSISSGFFSFFYYSFNAIHFNSINEVMAVNNYSRAIFLLEQFFALILGGIFFTLFLSTKNERESSDIDELIKQIKEQGDGVSEFMEAEYKLSINDAIKEIERLKGGMIKVISYLSKNIN